MMELMFAIGIMGIGMTMAAALFPAAIKDVQRSSNDVIGSLINDNALALIRTKYPHGSSENPFSTTFKALPIADFGDVDSFYPLDEDPAKQYGFLVLGRQVHANQNDYQFMIVSFRRETPPNKPELPDPPDPELPNGPHLPYFLEVNNNDIDDNGVMTVGAGVNLKKEVPFGTVVIVTDAPDSEDGPQIGQWARVANKDSDAGTVFLDPKLPETTADIDVHFVVAPEGYRGEILTVMTVRTGLRKEQ